jgi:RNA polymerase sigma-70 factor, ECF subfamily
MGDSQHAGAGASDEDLVRRVQAGDESATGLLFDRHARTLRARVRRGLPKALRAKVAESDVVQEAWLAAFLRLGEFEDRGEGSFARWMHTVLEHKLLDEVRRYAGTEKRDVRREVAAGSSVVRLAGAAPGATPSAVAVAAEERARVRAAVGDLPEAMRTLLRLVHDDGLTVAEAAARTGRSPQAARKLYGRAAMRLADLLDTTGEPRRE